MDHEAHIGPMKRGIINGMRREHGSLSLAIVFALVLPVLLALLPAPAISAEALVLREIEASVCDTSGQGGPHQQNQHDCCDCCILCRASGSHATLSSSAPVDATPARAALATRLRPALMLGLAVGAQRNGLSARGPPAV